MGCTHISYISSDILPATTLADNCYKEMFKGCTGLTSASKLNLPAGNTEGSLAESCYESMFEGCTNLRDSQVPELPAMTLAKNCYKSMFAGCHIYTTPTLPATTLVFGCYDNMFKGCTNLNKVICMATNVNNSDTYTSDWLMNVSSNGTFIKPDNMTGGGGGWQIGISGIPKEWFYAKFSVSGTQTVYFSKANLMAKFSKAGWMYDAVDGKNNCTWSFCNYTKMFVGTVSDGANTKINGFGTVSAGGDIDLFGWSKTGTGYYNNYYGICNTTTNDNYTGDLYDWGKTNVSGLTQWKTLTQAEWDYLLGLSGSGRTASTVNSVANARFAIIEVHQTNNYSTYGLMIFPDYYTHPNGNPVINNINSTSVVKNNISSFTYDEWYAMQCVGAVFLPMAGQRTGTTVSNCSETSSTVIGIGQYWSSTPNGDDEGYALVFGSGSNNTSSISIQSVNRYVGGCVRLVRKTD